MAALGRLRSIVLRLFVYYLLFLSFWKCPPSAELDESSPKLCYPLHNGFDLLLPHVQPHYEKYVQPVVNVVSPHVERGRKVVGTYVCPVVSKTYAKSRDALQPVTDKVTEQYERHLATHVEKIGIVTDKVAPYAACASQQVLEKVIQPVCGYSHVLLRKCQHGATTRVLPVVRRGVAYGSQKGRWVWSKFLDWYLAKVYPHIHTVYATRIEPQVAKIWNRFNDRQDVFDYDESVLFVKDKFFDLTSSQTKESDKKTEDVKASATTAVTSSSESSTTTTLADAEVTEAVSELEQWRELVHSTTKEAFGSFLDDVEVEKAGLIDKVRPKFTTLLQALQGKQADAVQDLAKLVEDIEQGADVSVSKMQEEFRAHAEAIRVSALSVRSEAEAFAKVALKSTEKIRTNTVEVLDEFAEVALQEIGRKLVSIDSVLKTPTSNKDGSKVNWKDWKEYRNLKDHLLETRQDIVDHEINMAEINKMLREAQETANILARDAAQYMSGLRGKAEYLYQERIRRKDKHELEEEEEEVDAEIYEELEDEDDVTETLTLTQTQTHFYTQTAEPTHTHAHAVEDDDEVESVDAHVSVEPPQPTPESADEEEEDEEEFVILDAEDEEADDPANYVDESSIDEDDGSPKHEDL